MLTPNKSDIQTNKYNTAAIRDLLVKALDDQDLTELCFDHFPSVEKNFTSGMNRREKIQLLLAYCKRYEEFDKLLALVQKINPKQYSNFSSLIQATSPSPQIGISSAKPLTPNVRPGKSPPFYDLDFLTFEELCRDLFNAEPSVAVCNIYGAPGQTQLGIDIFARRHEGDGIEVGQCKRYKSFTAGKIRDVSKEFFKHWDTHWAAKNIKRFILFVASDLKKTSLQSEIDNQIEQFKKYGIEYEAWSASTIRSKLRPYPGIVANYLGLY